MAPPRQPRRRPPADGDGVPRFEKKKTVKMNPVVGIILFVTPVVLLVVVISLWINRSAPQEEQAEEQTVEQDDWYDKYKKDFGKANRLAQTAMAARVGDDQKKFGRLWNEANDSAQKVSDFLDENLADYLDENGVLIEGYRGYNEDLVRMTKLRSDLMLAAPFGIDD